MRRSAPSGISVGSRVGTTAAAVLLLLLASSLEAGDDRLRVRSLATSETAARAALAAQIVGTTDVDLDGRRERVRTAETTLGSLIADAFVWHAQQLRETAGTPILAVTNGGGIRNDSVIQAGELTAADIDNILPFEDTVVVLEGVTVAELVAVLEISTASFPGPSGGFLQVSGFHFRFGETTGAVESIRLADGTLAYTSADGDLLGTAVDLVTNSFLAAGGDGYDLLAGFRPVDLRINGAQALRQFVEKALSGTVQGSRFNARGLSRISVAVVPEPATFGLALIGLLALAVRRRVRLYRRRP